MRRILILIIMAWLVGCASRPVPAPAPIGGKAFLSEKGRTLAPFAHVAFCLKLPGECENKGGASIVALTERNHAMIDGVNSAINSAIIPREDPARRTTWEINPPAGDCNDYAVSKRSELIQGGLPTNAVRLAIGVTPQGVGHTVVIVRTTGGDLVLDNRTYDIKRWDHTDLTWLKVEASADPRYWDSL